jgi:hypothetical protein
MASGPYYADLTSLLESHYASGTWRVTLVTNAYTPDLDNHDFWADASANEATGTGYTAGGEIIVPTVAFNSTSNLFTVTFPVYTWSASTITAAYAFYRKDTGDAATDNAGFLNDFGGDVSSTAGDFTVNASNFTIDFPD